jgi:hypothetical protein
MHGWIFMEKLDDGKIKQIEQQALAQDKNKYFVE